MYIYLYLYISYLYPYLYLYLYLGLTLRVNPSLCSPRVPRGGQFVCARARVCVWWCVGGVGGWPWRLQHYRPRIQVHFKMRPFSLLFPGAL